MRFATSLTLLVLSTGTAWAQAALDDEGKPVPTTDPSASPTSLETTAPVEYGVDLRIRQVFVPNGMLELFVERAAGGASNTGFGVDFIRRRGDVELLIGFEYEKIAVGEGVWIEKGNTVPGSEADYILGPDRGSNFGWFTLEFTFVGHKKLHDKVAFRYGIGAGLGILTGELQKYDIQCAAGATNANPEPGCTPQALGGQGFDPDGAPEAYDMPPVFPVVNGILGVQVRPTKKAIVNIEGGIRTVPFIGLSVGYFL